MKLEEVNLLVLTYPDKRPGIPSFSRVTYQQMAPLMGLDPASRARDLTRFEVRRISVLEEEFGEIVEDFQLHLHQYGRPSHHKDEEARSRLTSSVCI